MSQCLTQEQCNPCRGQLEDGPAPEQPPIDLSNFILAMGLNFLGDNPEHSMMEVRWKTDGSASDTAMERWSIQVMLANMRSQYWKHVRDGIVFFLPRGTTQDQYVLKKT
jgi:hypothetical protein